MIHMHICVRCNNSFKPTRGKQKYCSRRCGYIAMSGPGNSRWKGGYIDKRTGYRYICVRGKQMLEHRYIMECHLGRKLKSKEIVHHKDHNTSNNDIDNLKLVDSQAVHATYHSSVYRSKTRKQCTLCRLIKPRKEFSKNRKYRIGLLDPNDTRCKQCRALIKRNRH